MAFTVAQAFNATAECAAAEHPQLRLFTVATNFDWHRGHPGVAPDFNASGVRQPWSVASPDSVCGGGDFDFFSAVAYFFCRDLQARALRAPLNADDPCVLMQLTSGTRIDAYTDDKLGVPIGCVVSSVPGTNIELWSSSAAIAKCPLSVNDHGAPAPNWSALWDAMVAPLTRMTFAGAIWYQ
eukprot:gene19252-23014_t